MENQRALNRWIQENDTKRRDSFKLPSDSITIKGNLTHDRRASRVSLLILDLHRKCPSPNVPRLTIALVKKEDNGIQISLNQNGVIKITQPQDQPKKDKEQYPVKKLPVLKDKKRRLTIDERSTPDVEVPLDGDYSKAKAPTNQIPIAQFWGYCEQYLRPLTEDDVNGLIQPPDDLAPFEIPALGVHFLKQWEEEDLRHVKYFEEGVSNPGIVLNREYMEMDGFTFEGDVPLGSVTERLISCFVRESVVPDINKLRDEEEPTANPIKFIPHTRSRRDIEAFESKLQAELEHLGLYTRKTNEPGKDDVSLQLLQKQEELRQIMEINQQRKRKLYEIASRHLAFQEYNSLLDEVNKNVEQAFTKRFPPSSKSKQKKRPVTEKPKIPELVVQALHNRKRLINDVGKLHFDPESFTIPTESIFDD
ncbi:histone acetyltransferases subunit 3-domain-containing protein [Gorgonomyces haynaldii]|nr:histone acetyltransferases subunit 3-domain-containing protein [Gorgonomyces haynaldii]